MLERNDLRAQRNLTIIKVIKEKPAKLLEQKAKEYMAPSPFKRGPTFPLKAAINMNFQAVSGGISCSKKQQAFLYLRIITA